MDKIKLLLIVAFFTSIGISFGQEIYSKSYGDVNNKPIIFLHGGPGYNAVNFEVSTAEALANNGFYVIVYDRRGEGRSSGVNATYTFEEAFNDLNKLYLQYNIKKAILLGHSFGGTIATLYAEKYSEKVNALVLVSTPISYQKTLASTLASIKSIYIENNDTTNQNYVKMIEAIDKESMQYSSYILMHAMANKFYSPKKPTNNAVKIYDSLKENSLIQKYAAASDYKSPMGFWKNEKFTTIDVTENIKALQKNKINVFGIYGKDDGLISEEHIKDLMNIIGGNNVNYIENASHNVFIDQQEEFISFLKRWTK